MRRPNAASALTAANEIPAPVEPHPTTRTLPYRDHGGYTASTWPNGLYFHDAHAYLSGAPRTFDCEYAGAAPAPRLTLAYDRPRVLALICRRGRRASSAAGLGGVTR